MTERLREIAQECTGPGIEFLREEPEVVGPARHTLKHLPSLVHPPGEGQRIDHPEGGEPERALSAPQAVVS